MFVTLRGRTVSAVACGRRAWCRTRHPATKAARQSRGPTLVQACAALQPRAAQDRHRSTAQLSGRKGRNSGVGGRKVRLRKNGCQAEQPGGEQPSTDARTRASHPPRGLPSGRARLSRPETHTTISLPLRADTATLRTEAARDKRVTLSQATRSPV